MISLMDIGIFSINNDSLMQGWHRGVEEQLQLQLEEDRIQQQPDAGRRWRRKAALGCAKNRIFLAFRLTITNVSCTFSLR